MSRKRLQENYELLKVANKTKDAPNDYLRTPAPALVPKGKTYFSPVGHTGNDTPLTLGVKDQRNFGKLKFQGEANKSPFVLGSKTRNLDLLEDQRD